MSVKTPVEFEEIDGHVRAVDRETGESGTGENERDALTNLIKTLETLEDMQRVLASVEKAASVVESADGRSTIVVDAPERVDLERDEDGLWIATDTERAISSGPMDTWAEAIDDLDENVALADGNLELSEETKRAIEESAGEYERGETTSLSDLKRRT